MYTIYGTPSCPFCDKAKALLTEKDHDYVYHDVMSDLGRRAEIIALQPGFKTVPQIYNGEEYIGGFDELAKTLS